MCCRKILFEIMIDVFTDFFVFNFWMAWSTTSQPWFYASCCGFLVYHNRDFCVDSSHIEKASRIDTVYEIMGCSV